MCLILKLLLLATFLGLSSPCTTHFINITSQQWILPPTLAKTYSYCTYSFTFPENTFALLSVKATGVTDNDAIFLQNQHGDYFQMEKEGCKTDCNTMNSTTRWPGEFTVSYRTSLTTTMMLQINLSIEPMITASNTALTTATNFPSLLIYFQDWNKGDTYTITSKNSRVYLQVAVALQHNSLSEWALFNNIFVFDGKRNVGTLSHIREINYVSINKEVSLYAADTVSLRGAVFATDNSNVRNLHHHVVEYAPVFNGGNATLLTVEGSSNAAPLAGAVTIVGDKDNSTMISVRQLDNKGTGGVFTYLPGGPLAAHTNQSFLLTNSNLPKTFYGQMTTFYISKGTGTIKCNVASN